MDDPLVLYLENIIKPIVSEPEKVEVVKTKDFMGTLLTLRVSPEDVGKIIGFEGKTAGAIRHMLRTVGFHRNHERIHLKIFNPLDQASRYTSTGDYQPHERFDEPIIN